MEAVAEGEMCREQALLLTVGELVQSCGAVIAAPQPRIARLVRSGAHPA